MFSVTPLLLALNSQTDEAPQSSHSSKEELEDAIHEVDSPRYSNTGSTDRRDSFALNETRDSAEFSQLSPQLSVSSLTLPLESNHDINDSESNERYTVDTATFRLPIDIIPMTPPGSPIFEGLSQYMILEAVSVPGNQDDVSSIPVQRDLPTGELTLRPSSEVTPFGLPPSSSGNEQATNPPDSPGPNADVTQAIQLNSPYTHAHHLSLVQGSHHGRSTSPLEYMQSGILRFLPSIFVLRKEMIDRTT